MSQVQVPKLLRLLYVHNPFYLISACLFVYGLKEFFRPGNMDFLFAAGSVTYIDPWWLMGSLCGVTLLMATTAFLIVHFGKVWEDARSLVLVILLMLLAISVSFDEIIALVSFQEGQANQAVALMGFGCAFSIAVIESLLRGLKIRLPGMYRIPFYGLLALFFIFPMWVCPDVSNATPEQARWRVALFPTLAGLISLALLPAVRRGSAFVQHNGTPWSWPWFPWTVFTFMAGAVLFRSYSLAISFDRADARAHFWDSSFGLYFLVPFVLAALVVLLEVAIVEKLDNLRDWLVKLAPLTLVMAYPWLGPWTGHVTYTRFAHEFVELVASPVFITLMALLTFYVVAWWRGIKHAELGVVGCLAAAVLIGPRTGGARAFELTVSQIQIWPLAALGLIELGFGLIRRKSLATMIGATSLALGAGLLMIGSAVDRFNVLITLHLVLLSALLIGALFEDAFAKWLRTSASSVMVLAGCFFLASVAAERQTPILFAYSTVMAVVALGSWLWMRESRFLVAVVLNLCGGVLFGMMRGYDGAQTIVIPAGVQPLLWAAACFAVAVFISLLKGGFAARWIKPKVVADDPWISEPES